MKQPSNELVWVLFLVASVGLMMFIAYSAWRKVLP